MRAPAALPLALGAFCLALPVSVAGANIAAGLLAAVLIAWGLSGADVPWRAALNPACLALSVYCAAAAVVSLCGVDSARSLGLLSKDIHKLWILTLLLVALAAQQPPRLHFHLFASWGVVAVIGLGQAAASVGGPYWARPRAFVHPVTYGELMALGLLGALCLLAHPDERVAAPRSRRGLWAFLALCAAAMVLNQTRGAMLGLFAGMAAMAAIDKPLRRWALAALAALAAVLLLWEAMPTGGRSLRTLLEMPQLWLGEGRLNPFLARYALWGAGWNMFLDHPWTGVGPGNYREVFPLYFQGLIEGESVWGSAHNLYLHQLAERGLLGLAALALALGVLTVMAWRKALRSPDALSLWGAAAMTGFLVMNLTEVAFQNEQVTTLVLFIWAWSQAAPRAGPTEGPAKHSIM